MDHNAQLAVFIPRTGVMLLLFFTNLQYLNARSELENSFQEVKRSIELQAIKGTFRENQTLQNIILLS